MATRRKTKQGRNKKKEEEARFNSILFILLQITICENKI